MGIDAKNVRSMDASSNASLMRYMKYTRAWRAARRAAGTGGVSVVPMHCPASESISGGLPASLQPEPCALSGCCNGSVLFSLPPEGPAAQREARGGTMLPAGCTARSPARQALNLVCARTREHGLMRSTPAERLAAPFSDAPSVLRAITRRRTVMRLGFARPFRALLHPAY
ncbi:hypothetical protein OH77DRAFT_1284203 [Trametes cingulata]|nr:hypothetical protein OH77DRAFT_1284203 [Trametes cingulata]